MIRRDQPLRSLIGLAVAMMLEGCAAIAASTEQTATSLLSHAGSSSSATPESTPTQTAGKLVVTLIPRAAAALQRSTQAGHVITGIASLDRLCARYGVTELSPPLPTALDADAIRARFPERS
jgi:hypothetical protein